MITLGRFLSIIVICFFLQPSAFAQRTDANPCSRPSVRSVISEPEDLRSVNGVLRVDFTYRSSFDAEGRLRYCYVTKDGSQSPNLRLHPGDWLILTLKNDRETSERFARRDHRQSMEMNGSCGRGTMDAFATNLHFHGLSIPPVCHQDDVLNTFIGPGEAPFEYRFQIPPDQAPGLYWYHPHVHGFSGAQVLGGASGAVIVEGIERSNRVVAGMPERVIIVRDQELANPNAAPLKSTVDAPVLRDAEGDILNAGTGFGKPAKDLSINFVPVPFPEYPPAILPVKPSERQLWRILNASAVTYVDLQILEGGAPQPMGVVSIDGVPINEHGGAGNGVLRQSHALLPPAGRVEFIYKGPAEGARASMVTRSVDTGPAGENDPVRPLAEIVSKVDAPAPNSTLPASASQSILSVAAWLGNVKPTRERKLYFSEKPSDPGNPNSPTVFMLTVDGQAPIPYDPHKIAPNLTVHQGEVEDWTIENRTRELHAFHIHQIHFMLTKWNGVPVEEPYLRDTVNVAYWDGKSPIFPSVKLRMDFRDPNAIGTFVYHCHLLEHEDGGMMGTIRVVPSASNQK
jgi:FtsP/CotA-like multicopper oxidase with cupredoxin domain